MPHTRFIRNGNSDVKGALALKVALALGRGRNSKALRMNRICVVSSLRSEGHYSLDVWCLGGDDCS